MTLLKKFNKTNSINQIILSDILLHFRFTEEFLFQLIRTKCRN